MIEEKEFCHLHVHSSMSILDSLGKSEGYAEKSSKLGQKYLACSDHGNISGLITHQKACDEFGIKPIPACELYIVPNAAVKEKEKRGHLTVWVKNEIGWKNLLSMLSLANLYYFYYRPRVDYNMILEKCEGLIFGSACSGSVLNLDGGVDFFKELHKKVGNENIFLEIMPHDFEDQHKHNKLCLDLHKETGIETISSQDCHYQEREEAETHELLLCMQTKKKMSDPDRWKFPVDTFHMCSAKEMLTMWEEQNIIPIDLAIESMKNTVGIADRCNFRIEKRDIELPVPPRWEGKNEDEVLTELCMKGFERIFGEKINLGD